MIQERPVLSVKELVWNVRDSGGSRTFSAADLGCDLAKFQEVVQIARDAQFLGYVTTVTPHPSMRKGSGGLFDVVFVEGITEAGHQFLAGEGVPPRETS